MDSVTDSLWVQSELRCLSAQLGWETGQLQAQAGVLATSVGVVLGWDETSVFNTRIYTELALVAASGASVTETACGICQRIHESSDLDITEEQRGIAAAAVQLLLDLPVVWPDDTEVRQALHDSYNYLG